jgi:ATP/ADP translocase
MLAKAASYAGLAKTISLINLRRALVLTPLCSLLQLANVLSTEALFYTCIFPFIAFFGAFAFVFYPLRDTLHPTGGQGAGLQTHFRWGWQLRLGMAAQAAV